jgi:hypothetical protein
LQLGDLDASLEWAPIREVPPQFAAAVEDGQAALTRWIENHDVADLDELAAIWSGIVENVEFGQAPLSFRLDLLNRSAVALQWQAIAARSSHPLALASQRLDRVLELAQPGDLYQARYLCNLSSVLLLRFDLGEAPDALESGVDAALAAVTAAGGDPRTLALAQSNAAFALAVRYRTRGDLGDLRRAVDFAEAAVGAAEAAGSTRLARYRHTLATVLDFRFDAFGEIDDLNRGINVLGRPVGHDALREGERGSAQLGSMLRQRWFVLRDLSDLDRAIVLLDEAVSTSRGEKSPALLTNLGNALLDRYNATGDLDDLHRASEVHEHAVEITRPNDWQIASRHNNAGNTALSIYEVSGDLEVLSRAIEHYRHAVALTEQEAPELASRQYNLGNALQAAQDQSGRAADTAEAREAFRDACVNGLQAGLQWALAASFSWGGWAARGGDWGEAATAYGYGLEAIDSLFRRQLGRDEKETWLQQAQGLAAEAGFALAMHAQPADAAAAIERGRAFLLSEVLERDRAELAELERAGRRDLADRYRASSERLRAATTAVTNSRKSD